MISPPDKESMLSIAKKNLSIQTDVRKSEIFYTQVETLCRDVNLGVLNLHRRVTSLVN